MVPAPRTRYRSWQAWLLGVLVFGLVLAVLVWRSLPEWIERLLEREGEALTGAPVQTSVDRLGLHHSRLGATAFSYGGADISWATADVTYRPLELSQGRLRALEFEGPRVEVDAEEFARWLRQHLGDPDAEPSRDAPPEVVAEDPSGRALPPIPHPGLLLQFPLKLSLLETFPVDVLSAENGHLTWRRGSEWERATFDLVFDRTPAAEEGLFRLKSPRLFARGELTRGNESDIGVIRLAASIVDAVEVFRGLAPVDSAVHPDQWLPTDTQAGLREFLLDSVIEVREDALQRGGGVMEASGFTFQNPAHTVQFSSLILGFQLGRNSVQQLSFGVNNFLLDSDDFQFASDQVSLFFSEKAGNARIEISSGHLHYGATFATQVGLRLDLTPHTEWWTSPLEGQLGLTGTRLGEIGLQPFSIYFLNEGTTFSGRVSPLRSEHFPLIEIDQMSFRATDPLARLKEIEGSLSLARRPESRRIGSMALRAVLEEPVARLAWDAAGPAGQALGGGTLQRIGDEPPAWEFQIGLPPAVLGSWASIWADRLEFSAIDGSIRLQGKGAVDPKTLAGEASLSVDFDQMSFLAPGNVRVAGLHGGLALDWFGLPGMASEQMIEVDSIFASGVLIDSIRFRVHWPLPHRLELRELSMQLLGGVVRLRPVHFNPLLGANFDAVFEIDRIDAEAITSLFPDERYRVQGHLSGELPVRIEAGQLLPMHGLLRLATGSTGKVSILDPELRKALLEGVTDDPRLGVRDKLSAALRDGIPLHEYSIALFDPATTDFPAVVKMTGSIKSDDLIVESISFRLNYALDGVDWQSGFGWVMDLLSDFGD